MWNQVVGHSEVKEFLARYLAAQERPHALLFTGPEGVGKKLMAFAFAKSLLCLHHNGEDQCEACRLMNLDDGNFSHPDFLHVAREADAKTGRLKDLSIAQIKDLITKTAFAPVMTSTKVCIIEDIDKMSNAAANSFLKVLEEPPVGWVLILLASSEAQLLPTILSRVVRVRFTPLGVEELEQLLVERNIDAKEAGVLARLAEGSVGRALTLHEEQVLEWRKQGLALLEALPLGSPLNYLANRTWQQNKFARPEALLLVQMMQLLLRDMLVAKTGLKSAFYNVDMAEELSHQAINWSMQGLKQALQAVQEAYTALVASAGVRMTLESMALKIDAAYKADS